jgi:hypothetical protein
MMDLREGGRGKRKDELIQREQHNQPSILRRRMHRGSSKHLRRVEAATFPLQQQPHPHHIQQQKQSSVLPHSFAPAALHVSIVVTPSLTSTQTTQHPPTFFLAFVVKKNKPSNDGEERKPQGQMKLGGGQQRRRWELGTRNGQLVFIMKFYSSSSLLPSQFISRTHSSIYLPIIQKEFQISGIGQNEQ